jgi:hypothetical protein
VSNIFTNEVEVPTKIDITKIFWTLHCFGKDLIVVTTDLILSLFRQIKNNNTIVQKIVIDDVNSTYNDVGNRNNTHSRNSQPYLCNTLKNLSSYHQNPFCHQISNNSIKSISAISQNTLDVQEKLMNILKEKFSTIRNENEDSISNCKKCSVCNDVIPSKDIYDIGNKISNTNISHIESNGCIVCFNCTQDY